ncbi:hypothetical protein [Umezawaea beigongshangensis]|uniref:hypothetical protein n=1 Tax=Umezawaea beigongshangensis TaxID=2780383 RepID=UPI0018F1B415|nr:hypothetical protein [Umezawaea beigongshangensis]
MSQYHPHGQQYDVVPVSTPLGWHAPMPGDAWSGGPPPARPAELVASFWCWIAALVLSVLTVPVMMLLRDDAFTTAVQAGEGLTPEEVAAAGLLFRITVAMTVVGFVVAAAPYLVGALNLRLGRAWARIFLTLLTAPAALYCLVWFSVFATDDLWGGVRGVGLFAVVLTVLLTLAAVVLMFLPAANRYVAAGGSR